MPRLIVCESWISRSARPHGKRILEQSPYFEFGFPHVHIILTLFASECGSEAPINYVKGHNKFSIVSAVTCMSYM